MKENITILLKFLNLCIFWSNNSNIEILQIDTFAHMCMTYA